MRLSVPLAVSDGPRIEVDGLPEEVAGFAAPTKCLPAHAAHLTYRQVIDLAVDRASRELVREYKGNVTKQPNAPDIERESLHRLLKRYGMRADIFIDRTVTPPKL